MLRNIRTGVRPTTRVLTLGTRVLTLGLIAAAIALIGGIPALAADGPAGPRSLPVVAGGSTLERFDLSWQASSGSAGAIGPGATDEATGERYPAHIQRALADLRVDDLDLPDDVFVAADGERIDVPRLERWLAERGSPMAAYAEELVTAGIRHEVDPRLVVGIAVIESSAGQHLPAGSHNAWGWHGRGPHGLAAWGSWPESIDAFTEGLARVYDTDQVDERMARTYVPPNWQKWLRTVRWVIDDI